MTRGGRARRGNLVMHRFPGQSIYIGRQITLTILGITDDGEIKVSIEAPKWMAISRDQFTREEHLRFQDQKEREHGCPKCGYVHDLSRPCSDTFKATREAVQRATGSRTTLRDDENFREDYRHGKQG